MSDELRVPAEPINFDDEPVVAPPVSEPQGAGEPDLLAETLAELEATKLRIEALSARVEEAIGPVELSAGPVTQEPAGEVTEPFQAHEPVVEIPEPVVEAPVPSPAPPVQVPVPEVREAPEGDDFDYAGLAAAIGASGPVEEPAPVDVPAPVAVPTPQLPVVEAPVPVDIPAPQPEPAPAHPVNSPGESTDPYSGLNSAADMASQSQMPVEVPPVAGSTFPEAPQPEPIALPADPVVQTQPAGADPYASIIGVEVEQDPSAPASPPVVEDPITGETPQGPTPEAIDLLAAMAQSGGNQRAEKAQTQETLQLVREQAKSGRSEKRTHKNTRRKSDEQIQLFPVSTRFQQGRPLVITFTSPKGGVAKSTTAASMAGYIAKSGELSGNPVRVLLVDGDVANGNLALRVAQTLRPNMLDLLKNADQVKATGQPWGTDFSRDIAPFVLVDERIPNLALLAAPENASVINEITQQDLEDMVGAFARFYDVIIFDSGTQIVEHTNCAWLAFASQVYLMMEPEISCMHQTTEYAARAVGMNLLTEDRFRSVMIRSDMDLDGLDPQKVVSDMFPYIAPDKQFYIPDFHRDGIATANAGEILSLESQDYATAITRMVQSALESYERENGLR